MVLINSRVDALVRCLLIYRRLVADVRQLRGDDAFLDGDWPNEVVSTAIDAIRNVDPDALARGRFWPDALELS